MGYILQHSPLAVVTVVQGWYPGATRLHENIFSDTKPVRSQDRAQGDGGRYKWEGGFTIRCEPLAHAAIICEADVALAPTQLHPPPPPRSPTLATAPPEPS